MNIIRYEEYITTMGLKLNGFTDVNEPGIMEGLNFELESSKVVILETSLDLDWLKPLVLRDCEYNFLYSKLCNVLSVYGFERGEVSG